MILLLLVVLTATAPPAGAESQLHDLRAARRASVRSAALTKADGGAPFGLLVLPVDFADARFDADFDPRTDLAPRLADEPAGALGHYFLTASQERTGLVVVPAPVISLAGQRLDYSDIGWQGNERTRRMAREALEAADALGVDFRAADRDGDGEVDGVLILHAAAGLENDPDGFIVPLQYFLEDPVVQRGTVARSYAVAAERSTLGIWAHETAHLLGLEDRYDHALAGTAETGPRGGLGRYSLMASGWLGSGDGTDPALPDAYSRLALGWADLGDDAAVGTVVRLRTTEPGLPEYFLAEQRDPLHTAPYDAGIPADRALVYHVDTTLAEGQASSPTWPRHLRVQLLEADGGSELAQGENDGSPDDLFPFANQTQVLGDATIPNSRTWDGAATGVDASFGTGLVGLQFSDRGQVIAADLRLMLPAPGLIRPVARIAEDPSLPQAVPFELRVEDTTWGEFTGGPTASGELVRDQSGQWVTHVGPELVWIAAGDPPPGAATPFSYTLAGGALPGGALQLVWDESWSDLDLSGAWPGEWSITHPGDDVATTWHRWRSGSDALGPDVLIATGAAFTSAASWPDVQYANQAHARLQSPLLGAAVRWVELQHSPHLELLHAGAAVDGVALTWVHSGGATVTATPVDGWLGSVDARSRQPLAGQPTFAVTDSLDADGRPLWRREVLPLPDPRDHGPGPWRLQLDLASNPLYRDRGWLVQAFVAHLDEAPESAFPIFMTEEGLVWFWEPSDLGVKCFEVERSLDGGSTWQPVATFGGYDGTDWFRCPRELLGLSPEVRSRFRVVAGCGGRVASRAILVDGPHEPSLSSPRPNPCSIETSIRVDGAGDPNTEVDLFDLRGRRIRDWRPGGDPITVVWQGDDSAGRRVAAGVYIFRLRAQGRTLTRKVTWIR